jgi:hypothetical protein
MAFFANIIFPSPTQWHKQLENRKIETNRRRRKRSGDFFREKTSRAQYINATALRCSMATPFGLPVEPDV